MTLKGARKKISLILVNKLLCGTKFFNIKRNILNWGGVIVGDGSKVVGPITVRGNLVVGSHCWIGAEMKIQGNGTVTIDDNCDIGPEVSFLTGSHEIGLQDRRAGKGFNSNIELKRGVWIGARTTILGGVCVGAASMVGAGSLVNRDCPADVLMAGVPAKVKRQLEGLCINEEFTAD